MVASLNFLTNYGQDNSKVYNFFLPCLEFSCSPSLGFSVKDSSQISVSCLSNLRIMLLTVAITLCALFENGMGCTSDLVSIT